LSALTLLADQKLKPKLNIATSSEVHILGNDNEFVSLPIAPRKVSHRFKFALTEKHLTRLFDCSIACFGLPKLFCSYGCSKEFRSD
jgi:hypothetical protein